MEVIRVVDNTLPQSAWDHFSRPSSPYADPLARQCFREFINVSVNSPTIFVPIPQSVRGGRADDPFIRLTQELSTVVEAAATGWERLQTTEVIDTYFRSLHTQPKKWSGWIRFQCTDDIFNQFSTRVPDWRSQLSAAWERIEDFLEARPAKSQDPRVVVALRALERDLAEPAVQPRQYCAAAARLGVPFHEFMLAYGLNWFARGRAYARKAHSGHCGFHALRDAAAERSGDQTDTITLDSPELDWAEILEGYLRLDKTLLDGGRFVDKVKALRESVQGSDKFRRAVEEAHREEETARRKGDQKSLKRAAQIEDEAVAQVLTAVRLPLKFRSKEASWRMLLRQRLTDSLHGLEQSKAGKLTLLIPVLAKTIRIAMESRGNRLVDVRLRQRLGLPLWHIYEIPGKHEKLKRQTQSQEG